MPTMAPTRYNRTSTFSSPRGKRFGTILADPPWRFQNRTGETSYTKGF